MVALGEETMKADNGEGERSLCDNAKVTDRSDKREKEMGLELRVKI